MEIYSIYVGQLPTDITKEDLIGLFSDCGTVRNIYLSSPETCVPYCYAFVRFSEAKCVLKATQEIGHWTFRGRTLRVEIAHATKDLLRLTTRPRYPSLQTVNRSNNDRSRLKEACCTLNKTLDLIHGDQPLDMVWLLSQMEMRHACFAPRVKGNVCPGACTTETTLFDSIGAYNAKEPAAIEQRKEELRCSIASLQAELDSHYSKAASVAEQRREDLKHKADQQSNSKDHDSIIKREEVAPSVQRAEKLDGNKGSGTCLNISDGPNSFPSRTWSCDQQDMSSQPHQTNSTEMPVDPITSIADVQKTMENVCKTFSQWTNALNRFLQANSAPDCPKQMSGNKTSGPHDAHTKGLGYSAGPVNPLQVVLEAVSAMNVSSDNAQHQRMQLNLSRAVDFINSCGIQRDMSPGRCTDHCHQSAIPRGTDQLTGSPHPDVVTLPPDSVHRNNAGGIPLPRNGPVLLDPVDLQRSEDLHCACIVDRPSPEQGCASSLGPQNSPAVGHAVLPSPMSATENPPVPGDKRVNDSAESEEHTWYQYGKAFSKLHVRRSLEKSSDSGISVDGPGEIYEDTGSQDDCSSPDIAKASVYISSADLWKKNLNTSETGETSQKARSEYFRPLCVQEVKTNSVRGSVTRPGSMLQDCKTDETRNAAAASEFQGKIIPGGRGRGSILSLVRASLPAKPGQVKK